MKKIISAFLISLMTFSSLPLMASGFGEFKKNTSEVYQSGPHENATTNLDASMIGWGIGLAVGIAVLTALLHQSKAKPVPTPTPPPTTTQ